MNDKTQHIEGLRRLATNIKLIESYHTYSVWAGRHAMNSGLTFYEVKDHPDIKAWRQFKDDIVVELDAAIKRSIRFYCGFGRICDEGDRRCRTKNYISRYLG